MTQLSRSTILILALIVLPFGRVAAQSLRPELQQRIQSHAEPEEIPPPGTAAIRHGVISILAGAAISSGGVWASLHGMELYRESNNLYENYMALNQTASLQIFSDRYTAYADMQQQSIYYRVGGAAAVSLGIAGITYGMFQIRSAAQDSRQLAEENHELLADLRSLSGSKLIIEPRGVSLVWNF